jgi:hypothetical protein
MGTADFVCRGRFLDRALGIRSLHVSDQCGRRASDARASPLIKFFERTRAEGHTKHRWHRAQTNSQGTAVIYRRSRRMQCDRVIRQALCDARDILWANLPPPHNLPDDEAVAALRAVIAVPAVQEAVEFGNDTALCFVLRAVDHILRVESNASRRTIDRLWNVLDTRDVNGMLGLKQNAQMTLWRKKPPAL